MIFSSFASASTSTSSTSVGAGGWEGGVSLGVAAPSVAGGVIPGFLLRLFWLLFFDSIARLLLFCLHDDAHGTSPSLLRQVAVGN